MGKEDQTKQDIEIKDAGYLELFWEFFKLGMFTIGGGIAMIPLLHGVVADKKKWLSEDDVTDIIAVSQSLPGVVAINMATFVGSRKRGFLGALVATFGVILPSLVSIILILTVLDRIGENRYVSGAFKGIRAAATGLIAYSAYRISARSIDRPFAVVIAVAAFSAITFLDVGIVYVVIAAIVAGILERSVMAGRKGGAA